MKSFVFTLLVILYAVAHEVAKAKYLLVELEEAEERSDSIQLGSYSIMIRRLTKLAKTTLISFQYFSI